MNVGVLYLATHPSKKNYHGLSHDRSIPYSYRGSYSYGGCYGCQTYGCQAYSYGCQTYGCQSYSYGGCNGYQPYSYGGCYGCQPTITSTKVENKVVLDDDTIVENKVVVNNDTIVENKVVVNNDTIVENKVVLDNDTKVVDDDPPPAYTASVNKKKCTIL